MPLVCFTFRLYDNLRCAFTVKKAMRRMTKSENKIRSTEKAVEDRMLNESVLLKRRVIDFVSTTIIGKSVDERTSFSEILSHFADLHCSEEIAEEHWRNIISRAEFLERKLGRHVSVCVAVADYFTCDEKFFDSPVLVEIRVLRTTEKLAMIDDLTGVFNRRYMDTFLMKEEKRSTRHGEMFSVMILDIDDFKKVNDTYGHPVGDKVLMEAAYEIKSAIREEDVLCRYGGEEFVIIMPETEYDKPPIIYNRLRNKLKESALCKEHKITISAGCATFNKDAFNIETLIQCADIALYKSKRNGKDMITVYSEISE